MAASAMISTGLSLRRRLGVAGLGLAVVGTLMLAKRRGEVVARKAEAEAERLDGGIFGVSAVCPFPSAAAFISSSRRLPRKGQKVVSNKENKRKREVLLDKAFLERLKKLLRVRITSPPAPAQRLGFPRALLSKPTRRKKEKKKERPGPILCTYPTFAVGRFSFPR